MLFSRFHQSLALVRLARVVGGVPSLIECRNPPGLAKKFERRIRKRRFGESIQ